MCGCVGVSAGCESMWKCVWGCESGCGGVGV